MIYDFKPSDAKEFASFVGIRTKIERDELTFSMCPYCRGGGGKDKGTFSINLKTGQFKCLRASCGVSGNMITLSRDFDFSLGKEVDDYYRPKEKRHLPQPKQKIVPKQSALDYLVFENEVKNKKLPE